MTEWWHRFADPDGLVLRDRVLASVDPDKLLVALRSGRLRRVQRGVYLPRTVEYQPLTAARAAILSCGIADAVASHHTAGRVHDLALPAEPWCEDVTVPRQSRRKDRPDLRFHTRGLTVGDVGLRDGLPVTSLPRTVADLAADLDRLSAVWTLDDALRRRLCGRADVIAAIGRWGGGEGCVRAKQRLAEADGCAESLLETAGRLALSDAGLPLPVPQFEVFSRAGRLVARLDGGYPELKVGLEFDGQTAHELPGAVLRDRDRQNALLACGWTVLRFTWWDVMHDPSRFISNVRRVVVSRAASPAS